MRTWAEASDLASPSQTVDRDAGEGPLRCCARRLVAADALICYDDVSAELLSVLVTRFPHLEKATEIFLCDACADTLVREQLVSREDRAIDLGLSQEVVAKMRDQDLKARSSAPTLSRLASSPSS